VLVVSFGVENCHGTSVRFPRSRDRIGARRGETESPVRYLRQYIERRRLRRVLVELARATTR